MDFNCLNLVVSIDSWVAVLDFFGIAGDDVTDGEHGPEPQSTGTYGSRRGREGGGGRAGRR